MNERIALLAQTAAMKGEYVIGSGDVLAVEVFDVPELTRDVRVTEAGQIAMPLIPVKIQAAGLTGTQLQDKLAELLQVNGIVTTPLVTVTVKEQHSQPITVIGAVKEPQVIQAGRQMKLLEALSRAGGIAEDAGNQILVTRTALPADAASGAEIVDGSGSTGIAIDLSDLLDSGDPKFNIPLVGGDVISVPRAGVVYAVGAVQRPGGFVMQSDRERMTVLKVLSLSGGLLSTAKPNDAVILRNGEGAERQQVAVDLKKVLALKAEDVSLDKGDILFVPDSAGKRAWRRTGEIALSMITGVTIIRASR
jgi:polysaccharide export outer membrane protein